MIMSRLRILTIMISAWILNFLGPDFDLVKTSYCILLLNYSSMQNFVSVTSLYKSAHSRINLHCFTTVRTTVHFFVKTLKTPSSGTKELIVNHRKKDDPKMISRTHGGNVNMPNQGKGLVS